MKLIVGLGNPGTKYARTRHNVGVWAVVAIAEKYGFSPWEKKYDGLWCGGKIAGQKIYALLPQTFMNLSGQSVRAARAAVNVPIPNVIAFHDELDVAVGKVKGKQGGGAGGHNGIKSIDALMGKEYHRIRIGIGHPGHPDLVSDYVLSPPSQVDREELEKVVEALADAFPALVKGDGAPDVARYLNDVGMVLNPRPTPHPGLPPQGGKGQKDFPPAPSPLTGEGRGGGEMRAQSLRQFARTLRTNMTLHERLLWRHLRNEQLGVKFRRQHPMNTYIVDFVCLEKKLVIELDGGQHYEERALKDDKQRTAYLEKTGHRILRFSNRDMAENIEGVLQTIAEALQTSDIKP